jgi:hypothetical protein
MRLLLAAAALFAADLLLAFTLLPAPEIEAGTAVRLDVSGLARNAELIVEGRVLSARSVEADGLLQTEYLLEVARTFAGPDEPYRAFRLPGGLRADGSGLLIPGMPRIGAGEEVLLFLTGESRNGMRMPVGLAQGKFSLVTLPDGTKRLARETTAALVAPGQEPGEPGARTVMDYAEVVAEIQAALNRKNARR